jgi:hypothetical protein
MTSVPYTIKLCGGLAVCHGLIRPDGDSLVLEYQVQDSWFGMIRGKAKEVRVPLAELEAVELKGRWFSRTLIIQGRSMMALAAVPGHRQGRLELSVARQDLAAAEQLVAGVYE